MPTISVITVTHNAAKTFAACLDSVAAQVEPAEHLVVDAQSTDGTLDIFETHRPRLGRVISERDGGMYDAMNKGMRLASGEIIGFLHADDYYPTSDVLTRVAEVFADPSVDACYGDLRYVDQSDRSRTVRYWHAGHYTPRSFYWGWMPPHPTFFVRRAVYEKYGPYCEDLGTAADYELMLRLLLVNRIKAVYIPAVLVNMRVGGVSNASWKNRLKANRMDRQAWRVNHLTPLPWTLAAKPLRKIGQWFQRA